MNTPSNTMSFAGQNKDNQLKPRKKALSNNEGGANVQDNFIELLKGEVPTIQQVTFDGLELVALGSESIPTLIEPIVPSVGVWAIVGSSDTGKSMILRQLAICVAQGTDFLGRKINAVHNRCLFIATEDDSRSTGYILGKQAQTLEGLENIRFHFETDNIPEYIEEQLKEKPVDLIIIDAWSDVFGQNLNDSALIRLTLNVYRSIANKYQCSIGFLHHTGKRTQKLVPSKDNILSGQGFEAKMRLVMELRTDVSDEDYKHLCIVKGNYLGKEYKTSSYKLHLDPDNFLFTDTGERVPFDELAEATENNGAKKPPLLKADEIDDKTHAEILAKVFTDGLKPKLAELSTRISSKYGKAQGTVFGAKRIESYLDYLINDAKLIAKNGKDRSPKAYYYLTTHHLTAHP
jgi:hypothetical protein